jgi:hypothetical protein
MGDLDQQKKPTLETRHTQLSILNARSRMYATRLWTLPFLYLTAVAGIFSLVRDDLVSSWPATTTLFVLGVLVYLMMLGTRKANDRAVQWIAIIERRLGFTEKNQLEPTVKIRYELIDWAHYLLVLIALTVNFLLALLSLSKTLVAIVATVLILILGLIFQCLMRVKPLDVHCEEAPPDAATKK